MAKISPVSIKYVIHAKFSAQGALEKPDVIGAIFGQTEGLLGADLELRELQKEGKIGRVDVNLETSDGKTLGEIEIPSALDKAETTIIAAALETIERIGPSDAKIEIERIEDVRSNKREYIIERAKKLLEQVSGSVPESREIRDSVKVSARLSRLQEYGTERLPAGDISGEEIIVVEGRADVLNLLRNGINNVIAMDGTILPDTIKELSFDKEVTLFIDGDRGGKLIAKNVVDNARIDYVAVAPDGKEVEELSGKEILACLRKKIPVNEFFVNKERVARKEWQGYGKARGNRAGERQGRVRAKSVRENGNDRLDEEKKKVFQELLDRSAGTKSAILLDKNLKVIRQVSSSSLISSMKKARKSIYAIVMDGTVKPSVVDVAEKIGCKFIVARNFVYVKDTDVELVSL